MWNLQLLSSAITSWIKQSLQICSCQKRTILLCLSLSISKYILYKYAGFWLTGLNNYVQFYYFNLREDGVSEISIEYQDHDLMVWSRQLLIVSAIIYFLIE